MKILVSMLAALSLFGSTGALYAADLTPPGPLADYVASPDDSYHWSKRQEVQLGRGTFVELTLTSQTWRGIIWQHQLYLYLPPVVDESKRAVLLIDGGSWNAGLAGPADPTNPKLPSSAMMLALLADDLQVPLGVIRQVPQQPIFGGMHEDEIISYTFDQFFRTNEADWPLLLPMVKSAVRAMDAMQEYARQEWKIEIDSFTLTGASKRGWTTWLTSAVDSRVSCLAPMVIDMLNMQPQMSHQVASWGDFSDEIDDYTRRGLQQHLATPGGQRLISIVDPFSYRQAIVQPKLIVLGTNDRYWPLDALNLYWDELQGPKYVLYVPNNGHGIKDYPRVVGTVAALHRATAGGTPLPKLTWSHAERAGGLSIEVTSDRKPERVLAWSTRSATRDFRDSVWTSEPLEVDADGCYRHAVQPQGDENVALFVEAMYTESGATLPYYLSTNLRISPPLEVAAAATDNEAISAGQ